MNALATNTIRLGRLKLVWAALWCRRPEHEDEQADIPALTLCDCQPYPARVFRQCRRDFLNDNIQDPGWGE